MFQPKRTTNAMMMMPMTPAMMGQKRLVPVSGSGEAEPVGSIIVAVGDGAGIVTVVTIGSCVVGSTVSVGVGVGATVGVGVGLGVGVTMVVAGTGDRTANRVKWSVVKVTFPVAGST